MLIPMMMRIPVTRGELENLAGEYIGKRDPVTNARLDVVACAAMGRIGRLADFYPSPEKRREEEARQEDLERHAAQLLMFS